MEQKYTKINVDMQTVRKGDQWSVNNKDWYDVHPHYFGSLFAPLTEMKHFIRRPITEQYVYEDAGFSEDSISTIDIINIASAVWNGPANFYDEFGNEVTVRGYMNHSIELIADGDPISIQNLHTRKPAPRMMEINGVELVAPETEKPEVGVEYFYIERGGPVSEPWEELDFDNDRLRIGLWLKEEHCQQVIDAMKKVYFGGEV